MSKGENVDYNRKERKQAAKDGATLVSNSGRGIDKGDATWNEFLIDYKFNEKSFSLNINNWLKHKKDAWGSDNRNPAIVVVFDDKTEVAIIEWELLKDMRVSIDQLSSEIERKDELIDDLMLNIRSMGFYARED